MSCYISKLLVQTLFFSSALASADAARPFLTPSNPVRQQALKIRGGWTGVDTTKAITKLGLVVGTATSLSANTVLDKSGIENVDPSILLVTRRIGDTSASTAVGIACLPCAVELSKTLFDGTHKELEIPAAGQAFVLFVSAFFSFSLLNDFPLSKDTLLKFFSGWCVLNGVFLGCFPKLACKVWGDLDATGLSVFQYFVSLWGFSVISIGTLSGCLATGMTSTKALSFGAVPFFSRFILSKFV